MDDFDLDEIEQFWEEYSKGIKPIQIDYDKPHKDDF